MILRYSSGTPVFLPNLLTFVQFSHKFKTTKIKQNENCAVVGYHRSSDGNFLLTFREKKKGDG